MKILVWGTGRLAGKVIGKYISLDFVDGFIDNAGNKEEYMGKRVYTPQDIIGIEYDAILVANLYSREIYDQCIELGIDLNRVIFIYQNYQVVDLNRDYEFVKRILGEQHADIILNRYCMVRKTEVQDKLCLNGWKETESYQENDYVRMKSFELAVKEIHKRGLKGDVAEAGVFRGEFAQFINYAFPDKDLYLFDTFEGFAENEALAEVTEGNCTEAFINAYKQTNIEAVLVKMKYPEKVIVRQGLFPDSAYSIETDFAFVSLDMDFEESTLAGLKYFYPRLQEGGYIFVHDYNSGLRGVEKAVDKYEYMKNVHLCKVSLCDANGTLVITK